MDAKQLVKKIKDDEIKFVDLRFTDPRGKMQHVTMDVREMDEDAFTDGIMFDGSSIAGWKAINESDMKLMPDTSTAVIDPFFAQSTLAVFCDVLEPLTNEPYERDPRGIAKELGVTLHTCRGYVKGVLAKLGVHSQLEAVVLATRTGLIRLGD